MPLTRILGQRIGGFRDKAGLGQLIRNRYREPANEGLWLGGGRLSEERPRPEQQNDTAPYKPQQCVSHSPMMFVLAEYGKGNTGIVRLSGNNHEVPR